METEDLVNQILISKTTTGAGRMPLPFHKGMDNTGQSCPGSNQLPGKTLPSDQEILGICGKCPTLFAFDRLGWKAERFRKVHNSAE